MKRMWTLCRGVLTIALVASVTHVASAADRKGGSSFSGGSRSLSTRSLGSSGLKNLGGSSSFKAPVQTRTFPSSVSNNLSRSPNMKVGTINKGIQVAPRQPTFASPINKVGPIVKTPIGKTPISNPVKGIGPINPTNPIVKTPIINPIKPIAPIGNVGPIIKPNPIGPIVTAPPAKPICPPHTPCPPKYCPPKQHCPSVVWSWLPGGHCQNNTVVVQNTIVVEVPVAAEEASVIQDIPLGSTVDLPLSNLSEAMGGVSLRVGEVALGCQVTQWSPQGVQFVVPMLGIAGPTAAEISVLLPDGQVVVSIPVRLLPAATAVTQN